MSKRLVIFLATLFVLGFSTIAFANVRFGMTGSAVQSVQYMLINAGYLQSGADDGVFGSATQNAVCRFQADQGLESDGVVGAQTAQALSEATGMEAPDINSSERTIVMEATAYTAADPGNSGITANGHRLTRGLVSVDPSVIPLGTRLYIEGYGEAIADDTGGAIVGNRIDLGMDSRDEALDFGRQDVVVHIL